MYRTSRGGTGFCTNERRPHFFESLRMDTVAIGADPRSCQVECRCDYWNPACPGGGGGGG